MEAERKILTPWSVTTLEDLTSNHASNVTEPVGAQDNATRTLPWRVASQPNRNEGPSDKDTGQADMCKAVPELVIGRNGHDDEADHANTKADNDVNAPFAEVVTRVYEAEKTGNSTAPQSVLVNLQGCN